MTEWILLVDDEPHLLIASAHRLRSHGYHVLTARDGREALRVAETRQAHLVILDIRMPGIDGFETFERLKAIPGWADVPVIFLTANAQPCNREKALEIGSPFFLQKPCETSLMLEAVREALAAQPV